MNGGIVVWPVRGHLLTRFACVLLALVAIGVTGSASSLTVSQVSDAAIALAFIAVLVAASGIVAFVVACILGWRAHLRSELAKRGWDWFITSCCLGILAVLLLVEAFLTVLLGVRNI